MITELTPNGDLGKEVLPIEFDAGAVKSFGYAKEAQAAFDWYNDRLQILVYDGHNSEPVVQVRLDSDGVVNEIIVRSTDWHRLRRDSCLPLSPWQAERDNH